MSLLLSGLSDRPEDCLESGSVLLEASRFRLCLVIKTSFSSDRERLCVEIASLSDDRERLCLVSTSFSDDKERRAFKGISVKNESISIDVTDNTAKQKCSRNLTRGNK